MKAEAPKSPEHWNKGNEEEETEHGSKTRPGNNRNVLRNGNASKAHRITADNMTRKQEALLKNRLKNLVK